MPPFRSAVAFGHSTVRRALWTAAAVGAPLWVGGCTVGPDFHPPQPDAPAGWAGVNGAATQPSVATTEAAMLTDWWTNFQDATLDSLIERAIESNYDLRRARARVRQARASRGVAASGLYPNLNSSGDYRRSGAGPQSGTVRTITNPDGSVTSVISPGGSSHARDLFQVGLDAAWEIDVFGGTRRDVEASEAEIEAAIEDRRDVMVTLVSEVALTYLDLRSFQRQIAIALRNLDAQRRSADLTRRRFEGGFVSRLDLANAEAQVASTTSQIPSLEAAARQSIYSLSVLLGREPATLLEELAPIAPIPTTPPAIPVGLPSDLLRRRPDIRRAEAQLHAATARIGVAVADYFPRFSLTGSAGLSGSFEALGDIRNHSWSFGPTVTWPIFAGGRIVANVELQNARQEEALATYEQTVLVAFQDVENALIAYEKEQQRREALTAAVAANRQAFDLATQLYTNGQTDFLNVLQAQGALFGSEDALVQSDRTVSANLVSLYKALGGGWERELNDPVAAEGRPMTMQ